MAGDNALNQGVTVHIASPQETLTDLGRWDFFAPPEIQGLATWEWNIPANTVIFSKEWRHVLQDQNDASLGPTTEAWWPRMHEDDVLPFMEMARDIVEGRSEIYRTLFRVRRADGSWAWLLSKGIVAEKENNGQALRVVGALMDVSELRSDTKFRHGNVAPGVAFSTAMLDNAPDLIVRLDRDLSPIKNNLLVARLMSGKREQCEHGDEEAKPHFSQAQLDFLRNNVEKVLRDGVAVREVVSFATRYGHDVVGEYSFWPEYDEDGRVAAVMTQFRDVTDQVLAERRARLNEMRLNALYQLTQMDSAQEQHVLRFVMDSIIRITGSQLGFLFFPGRDPGDADKMLWSETSDEIITYGGEPAETAFPDFMHMTTAADGKKNFRQMKNGNGLHPLYVNSDGSMRLMRYILAPVVDGGETVCVAGVFNKETDYADADLLQLEAFINGAWLVLRRHELIRELHRAKEAAEMANKVKDVFLANISHELRTPLNGMLSMLQLLDLSALEDDQQQYVRTASFSGQALLRIISDILDFSHMASGKMRLREEAFDFRLAMESCLNLFRREARKKGLNFIVSLDDAIPRVLLGDDARVMQVVFNIVGNALKFTEAGSIRVDCSFLSRNREGHVRVYLGVRDTGIGIPAEKLESIFDAFTQIDSSPTRRYPGTGLGLGIARNLVELMGGNIAIESEVGQGTTIHCSFCFAMPATDPEPALGEQPAQFTNETRSLDILVAEDDSVGSFALRKYLQRLGHRPVGVPNGMAALEALRLHPFHCLFTDIQMPVMDGIELIRRIRENRIWDVIPSEKIRGLLENAIPGEYEEVVPVPSNLPVITVSAHAMTGDRERFLEAGMDFYLSKPLVMDELATVLKKIAVHLVMQEKLLTDTYISTNKEVP